MPPRADAVRPTREIDRGGDRNRTGVEGFAVPLVTQKNPGQGTFRSPKPARRLAIHTEGQPGTGQTIGPLGPIGAGTLRGPLRARTKRRDARARAEGPPTGTSKSSGEGRHAPGRSPNAPAAVSDGWPCFAARIPPRAAFPALPIASQLPGSVAAHADVIHGDCACPGEVIEAQLVASVRKEFKAWSTNLTP